VTTAAAARRSREARLKRRAQARRYLARRIARARVQFDELIQKLGGVCVRCGERGETAPLSVHHVKGLAWPKPHREYRLDVRVQRYCAEYASGVPLAVLCVPCNSAVGRPAEDLEEAPF
jgi:hypothetical protein